MPQARKTRDGPNEREEGGERDGMACAGSTKMGRGGATLGMAPDIGNEATGIDPR
jgi:hypothetical protein